MGALLTRLTAGATLAHIRQVTPVAPAAATGLVAQVYAQVRRDFGMLAPPLLLHSPAPEPLAASWLLLRETLVAAGLVDRAAKEAIAAAVSLGNACPYCVDVHGTTLHGLARGSDAAAIAADRISAVADPELRTIAAWARTTGRRAAAARHELPCPAEQVPEYIGVAVVFHYLNRMVNVFLAESPFPAGLPAGVRAGVQGLAGRLLRPIARRHREPGAALDLLPAAPLAADLSWAAGSPNIGAAFARAAAAVDAAGARTVPASVRALVAAELAGWDGQPVGISRGWVDGAVAGLAAGDRPAGRLALLTALASYQVDGSVIEEYRQTRPGDAALVELTAWASLAAARRVGSWLPTGPRAAAS
jgi:AhpD family alkylhydroperoxidase